MREAQRPEIAICDPDDGTPPLIKNGENTCNSLLFDCESVKNTVTNSYPRDIIKLCYFVETRNSPAFQITAASEDAVHHWHGGLSVIEIFLSNRRGSDQYWLH